MAHDVGNIDLVFLQNDLPANHSGHIEKVIDEPDEMARLPLNHHPGPLELRPATGVVTQDLHCTANRGEWIAQLVTQHRQKLVLAAVHLAQGFFRRPIGSRLLERRPDDVGNSPHELYIRLAPIAGPRLHD